MKIITKQQFYKLYEKGLFGNKLKTWENGQDLLTNLPNTSITLRTNKVGNSECVYNVNPSKINEIINLWISKGIKLDEITANESAPDSYLIFQGELYRTSNGLYLHYSEMKDKMRVALSKDPHHLYGLRVLNILKSYMTPSSYDDIMELLDCYNESVIEFGVYSVNLGNCKSRNAIIWEVRNY